MGRSSDGEAASTGDALDRVHRLEFDVDWPPGHAAAYLIPSDEPILVDAGAPGEENEERFRAGLDDVGLAPAAIDHVLITHPHTDHIGQLPAILDEDVRLYAPTQVLDQLRRPAEELAGGVREVAAEVGLDPDSIDQYVEQAVDSLERSRRLLPPGRVDQSIAFGESFFAGGYRFDAIHTPGHQIHHACYFTDLDGVGSMFTGDALIESFRAAALHVGLDHGAFDAVDAFYRGFDALERAAVDRAFPGHGPVFEEYDRVVARSRERLDGTVADVAETVAEIGPATPLEITMARVDELEHPAVLLDTIGALGHLDGDGRVRFERDENGRRQYRPP